jgi:hypothetical protein
MILALARMVRIGLRPVAVADKSQCTLIPISKIAMFITTSPATATSYKDKSSFPYWTISTRLSAQMFSHRHREGGLWTTLRLLNKCGPSQPSATTLQSIAKYFSMTGSTTLL